MYAILTLKRHLTECGKVASSLHDSSTISPYCLKLPCSMHSPMNGRVINNLRFADVIALLAESEEDL